MQLFHKPACRGLATRKSAHVVQAQMSVKEQVLTIKTLPQRYKGVLLDQFGVLHDGTKAYPGAVEAVEYLSSHGVALLIISNSSRRSSEALKNIGKLGFSPSHFAGVVTSGETAHQQLQQRPTAFWQGLGRRCLHFTWAARGAISLEGLGLEVTQDPAAAEFILAHGTEALGAPSSPASPATTAADGSSGPSESTAAGAAGAAAGGAGAGAATPCSLEEMEGLMRQCAAQPGHSGRGVPMIVANPDVVTVHGSELRTMPGTLARMYKEMGGEVHLMGKPAPIIYEAALSMLGMKSSDVVAIGDSLEHDIAGAQAAGVDSLFIAGGIHGQELQLRGEMYSQEELQRLCSQYGAAPTHVLPWFRL